MDLTVNKHSKEEQDTEKPNSTTLPRNIITKMNGSTPGNNLVNTDIIGLTIETKSNTMTSKSLSTLVNKASSLKEMETIQKISIRIFSGQSKLPAGGY
eukprot:7219269-Ditylum_brightwellii.AAC.1